MCASISHCGCQAASSGFYCAFSLYKSYCHTYIAVSITYNTEEGEEEDSPPKSKSADSTSLLSHATTAISSVSQPTFSDYSYHKILKWLQFVDNNLNRYTSIQLLFLGARSEIGEGQYENCKRPSEFYLLLQESGLSPEEALARFMYALKGLGKTGKYCNDQFFKKTNTHPPSIEVYERLVRENKNKKFAFCQCLVRMCMIFKRDSDISRRFRQFVCQQILAVRAQNEDTVAKVFLRLFTRPDIFSEEKHEQLALALDRIGATACMVILQDFRSQFAMADIDVETLAPQRDDNVCELNWSVLSI